MNDLVPRAAHIVAGEKHIVPGEKDVFFAEKYMVPCAKHFAEAQNHLIPAGNDLVAGKNLHVNSLKDAQVVPALVRSIGPAAIRFGSRNVEGMRPHFFQSPKDADHG